MTNNKPPIAVGGVMRALVARLNPTEPIQISDYEMEASNAFDLIISVNADGVVLQLQEPPKTGG